MRGEVEEGEVRLESLTYRDRQGQKPEREMVARGRLKYLNPRKGAAYGNAIHGKRRKTCIEAGNGAEGGCVVTSPLDPELITEAETIEEAFAAWIRPVTRKAAGGPIGSPS